MSGRRWTFQGYRNTAFRSSVLLVNGQNTMRKFSKPRRWHMIIASPLGYKTVLRRDKSSLGHIVSGLRLRIVDSVGRIEGGTVDASARNTDCRVREDDRSTDCPLTPSISAHIANAPVEQPVSSCRCNRLVKFSHGCRSTTRRRLRCTISERVWHESGETL